MRPPELPGVGAQWDPGPRYFLYLVYFLQGALLVDFPPRVAGLAVVRGHQQAALQLAVAPRADLLLGERVSFAAAGSSHFDT